MMMMKWRCKTHLGGGLSINNGYCADPENKNTLIDWGQRDNLSNRREMIFSTFIHSVSAFYFHYKNYTWKLAIKKETLEQGD